MENTSQSIEIVWFYDQHVDGLLGVSSKRAYKKKIARRLGKTFFVIIGKDEIFGYHVRFVTEYEYKKTELPEYKVVMPLING